MPVKLYQKLADKHNLVLACSNNSHNGPIEPSIVAGNAVLDDVFARFNIDHSFVIASGFSGGGRTATDFALRRGTLVGVISCGAALPLKDKIPFVEIVGLLDMNYQEALSVSSYLNSINNASFLICFYGGHEWPPVESYDDAIEYHELRNKKLNASEFFSDQMKEVKVQMDSGYVYEANRMVSQLLPDFAQSKEAFTIDMKLASIQRDKRFKVQATEAGLVNSKEVAMQKEFREKYKQQITDSEFHPEYWQTFRADSNAMLAGSHYQKLAALRLIDFGWRLVAEQQYFFEQNKQDRESTMSRKILDILSTNGVKGR